MKTLEELKQEIGRRVTAFEVGGFRPLDTIEESWIARVTAYKEEQQIPLDDKGREMIPLLQLYLPNLPFVPKALEGIELLTVFMSYEFPEQLEPMGNKWIIREYTSLEEVVQKDLTNKDSILKAFPLKPRLEEVDFPIWDGGGLTLEQEDRICEMEDEGVMDSYYDEFDTHCYDTKLGGYPSYCQSGIGVDKEYGEGYEFVFQISTNEKVNLNVVDNGSFMFARNAITGDWSIYYDFY
ncbi:DUF1963 domain-containing protein [Myroides marinus]|uniref:DUF1963 domain-containing protein n=1 Tax=Myroides marinus TaxID=703342 RepID=UPI002576B7D5|nr:DUF1963 domain-containing protein [Myroides marinus]MDM1361942.1 DUF1963 domain-containing protein [Myroides marinus]